MLPPDVELGGTTPADEYLYRPGELLVHAEDCDRCRGPLDEYGYEMGDRHGPVHLFRSSRRGQHGVLDPSVPDVLRLLRARVDPAPRVSPHYVFGMCQRIPTAADFPLRTEDTIPIVPALASNVTVGVIDTGIVLHDEALDGTPHSFLDGRVDFDRAEEDHLDVGSGLLDANDAHGTFVAGLLLAEAPGARVRMIGRSENGLLDDGTVAEAVNALGADVKLINLSFCGDTNTDQTAPPILEHAIAALPDDVVVVAAAGNFGDNRQVWPAALKRVIAVGAVDDRTNMRRERARWSSYGSWVDVYTSGVNVLGPFCSYHEPGPGFDLRLPQVFTGWARWSGTSFAAAKVTGRIAQVVIEQGVSARDAATLVLASEWITITGGSDTFERPYVA